MGVGEFFGAFGHEGVFELFEVDIFVDFGEDFLWGHFVDRAGEGFAGHVMDGGVGVRRVGLDVGAGEGGDVFVSGIPLLFDTGAGEDDFLFQPEPFVFPPRLIVGPEAFDVDEADLALGGL